MGCVALGMRCVAWALRAAMLGLVFAHFNNYDYNLIIYHVFKSYSFCTKLTLLVVLMDPNSRNTKFVGTVPA